MTKAPKKPEIELRVDDRTAERIVVKKFLTDYDYATLISEFFDRRFFEKESTADLLLLAVEYFKTYHKIPDISTELGPLMAQHIERNAATLKYDYPAFLEELGTCLKVEISDNKEFIKTAVLNFIKYKAMYFGVYDNLTNITEKKDVGQCIELFQKVSGIDFDQDVGLDYFKDLSKNLEEISNPAMVLPTGYGQLDRIIEGGIPLDEHTLTVFMAQPGLGKSMMLSNLAVNFLMQNLYVVIISLEMSERVYSKRMHAHISGTGMKDIRGSVDKVEILLRTFRSKYPGCDLMLKQYAPQHITTHTIINYMKKLKLIKKRDPDVLIVDYINLLLPTTHYKGQNSYERVGDVTRDLRGIGYLFPKLPILSVTQTNRSGYDTNEIGMENTSESTGINNTVDFLGALWQNPGDKDAGKLNMTILKDRYGGNNNRVLEFRVDYNTLRIIDPSDAALEAAIKAGEAKSGGPEAEIKDIMKI